MIKDKLEFRKLRADEIDVRIGTVAKSGSGISLLLYKDARADMKILDETVGILNWKRRHSLIDGQLFCEVAIYNENIKEWITKEDVGVESYAEKEKGRASDSFKRACFNFGIGRELYTAPFIWIGKQFGSIDDLKINSFKVKSIGYDDDGNINKLQIIMQDRRNNYKWVQVFDYNLEVKEDREKKNKKKEKLRELFTMVKFLKISNEDMKEKMKKLYGVEESTELSVEEIENLIDKIALESAKNGKK